MSRELRKKLGMEINCIHAVKKKKKRLCWQSVFGKHQTISMFFSCIVTGHTSSISWYFLVLSECILIQTWHFFLRKSYEIFMGLYLYVSAEIQGLKNSLADGCPTLSSEKSESSEKHLIYVICFPPTTRKKKELHFHLLKKLKCCKTLFAHVISWEDYITWGMHFFVI